VRWLARKTGQPYRLLSEAEREYAARAGSTTPFWWGAEASTDRANYNGDRAYGCGAKGEFRGRPVRVDSFAPNPWGFYQTHGNVADWVADCWNPNYEGAPADGSAWTSGDCYLRVTRGGGWSVTPALMRSASRVPFGSDIKMQYLGVRVARTLRTGE
jgi:formylglycine-generating enzyme required for sulfatase activity